MKNIIKVLMILLLICGNTLPAVAVEDKKTNETYVTETEIAVNEKIRAAGKVTGTKTTKVKSGTTVLWTVTVIGTFEYDGSHSTCTTSSVSTTVSSSYWKISSKSATKSGSSATAKATGQRYNNGVVVETHTESVTLVCGSDGTLY